MIKINKEDYMKCPYDNLGCTGVDTSGMDKIDCKNCPRYEEKKKKDKEMKDWNEFMMGL